MQIRLDPWPIDTKGGQMTLQPFEGEVFDVETDSWHAIDMQAIPQRLAEVLVIDGKPRMEARLLIEKQQTISLAGFGAYVVGAVRLCPHGRRQAEVLEMQLKRVLVYQNESKRADTNGIANTNTKLTKLESEIARLSPKHPHTGLLDYQPTAYRDDKIEGASAKVQSLMLEAEQRLGRRLASELPIEAEDEDTYLLPEKLVLQDGSLDISNSEQSKNRAILGCIKTLHTDYLGTERNILLSQLQVGQRTPILRFSWSNKQGRQSQHRFTWYVRLCRAPFYQHPLAGVMRLEMYAPDDSEFVPRAVKDIANLSGALMCKLSSLPHKDKRAPQNLVPTLALEQAMGRSMGSIELVTRRIRRHLVQEFGQNDHQL